MKNLFVIAAAAMMIMAVPANAQNCNKQCPKQQQQCSEPCAQPRMQRGQMNENGEPMTPEQIAEKQTERMTETLSLSKSQKKDVYKLNLERAKAQEAKRAEAEKMREARKTEMEQFDADMKKVLSDEQYATWQQNRRPQQGANANADCPHKGHKQHYGKNNNRKGAPKGNRGQNAPQQCCPQAQPQVQAN